MTNKIRVLQIGLSPSFGGIESFLLALCAQMDQEKYSFDFVAYDQTAARESDFSSIGDVFHIKNRKNPLAYAKELSQLYSRKYDIIHIHKNSAVDVVPFICSKYAGNAKLIAHSHSTSSSVKTSSFIHSLGRKEILKVSKRKLACSAVAGQWLYGNDEMTDRIVPNGIDLNKYSFNISKRQKMREKLGLSNTLVLGCVGRFCPAKNQAFVLRVLKKLRNANVNAKALFLGDGAGLNLIKTSAKQLNVFDHSVFTGSVRNVCDYMQAMDVLLMPSLYEGLPIVAIEAQASGLPVLLSSEITDEVCLTEAVRKLSIEPDHESDWVKAVCESTGHNNRKIISNARLGAFDIANTVEIIDEEYQNVLA